MPAVVFHPRAARRFRAPGGARGWSARRRELHRVRQQVPRNLAQLDGTARSPRPALPRESISPPPKVALSRSPRTTVASGTGCARTFSRPCNDAGEVGRPSTMRACDWARRADRLQRLARGRLSTAWRLSVADQPRIAFSGAQPGTPSPGIVLHPAGGLGLGARLRASACSSRAPFSRAAGARRCAAQGNSTTLPKSTGCS